MKTRKKDKSLKRLFIIAVLTWAVAALTVTGVGYFLFGDIIRDFFAPREVIVIPQYVGCDFDAIVKSVKDGKIVLEYEPVFSSDMPKGRVISQFPYGGAKRKLSAGESCSVRLTVSIGKEREEVPDLKGFKYTAAAAVLRSLGATVRIVSVYDDASESDAVLRTSPSKGERIENGDTVTLFVSRKHVHGSVCVGDFVGMPLEEAISEILASGLTVGEIKEEYSKEHDVGCVTSQSILPKNYVTHGTKIDITVNSEEKGKILHPFRDEIIGKDGEINESND